MQASFIETTRNCHERRAVVVQLRPYQKRAVDALREHLRAGRKRLLLCAPTGAGKTVIAAHVLASAHARGSRVLFLAHRRELIAQTVNKLVDAGVPDHAVSVMMGNDRRADVAKPVQVASVDTLRNRERPLADLVMVDECHRSLASTYLELIDHYTGNGAAIVGLTATPYRADGRGLGDVYEALEVVATPTELIEQGFIIAPRVFAAAGPDLRGVRTRGGDYVERDLADAVNTGVLVGDIVEHWQRLAEGRRTVAFAVNVEHSKHIAERFRAAGVPAEHLDGATPTHERDAILARLESGETLIVSNCGVLCEGWDQPSVKCAILARPTKSTGLYLQQAGRILRPWQGLGALVLDHAGNAIEHGLPQDDRDLSLEPTKGKNGKGQGPTKTCGECEAVIPLGANPCPECGAAFGAAAADPTAELDGNLVEVPQHSTAELVEGFDALVAEWERRNAARARWGKGPMKPGWIVHRFVESYGRKPPRGCQLPIEQATEAEKDKALAELRQVADQRGYLPGWIRHRFAARFGHAPGAA